MSEIVSVAVIIDNGEPMIAVAPPKPKYITLLERRGIFKGIDLTVVPSSGRAPEHFQIKLPGGWKSPEEGVQKTKNNAELVTRTLLSDGIEAYLLPKPVHFTE